MRLPLAAIAPGVVLVVLCAGFGVATALAARLHSGQREASAAFTVDEIAALSRLAWCVVGLVGLAIIGSVVGLLVALASWSGRDAAIRTEAVETPARVDSRLPEKGFNPFLTLSRATSGEQSPNNPAEVPITAIARGADITPPLPSFQVVNVSPAWTEDTFVLMIGINDSEQQGPALLRRGAMYLQETFETARTGKWREHGCRATFMVETRAIVAVMRRCSAEKALTLAVALHRRLDTREPSAQPLPIGKGRKSVWFREMPSDDDHRPITISMCGEPMAEAAGTDLLIFPTQLLAEARRLASIARHDHASFVVNDYVQRCISTPVDFKSAKVLSLEKDDGEAAPTTVILRAIDLVGGKLSQPDGVGSLLQHEVLSLSGQDRTPSDDETTSLSVSSWSKRESRTVFEVLSSFDDSFSEAVTTSPGEFARVWASLWDAVTSSSLDRFREAAAILGSGNANRIHIQRLLREVIRTSDVLPAVDPTIETSSASPESPQHLRLPFAHRPRFDSQFTATSEVEIDPTVARQLQLTSRARITIPKGLLAQACRDSDTDLSLASSSGDDKNEPFRITDGKGAEWHVSQAILGAGRSGTVHLGLSSEIGSICAVKAIPLSCLRNMEGGQPTQTDLRAEVETLCRLRHPNLLRLLGFASTAKTAFLIMEYVSGGTLDGLVESFGRLPMPTAKVYARAMLQGLACLHRHGIIHRDLKPPNVLVSVEGECKISDFGSAVRAPSDSTEDSAASWLRPQGGVVAGSPLFMAPEQARAEAVPASDIWSLGLSVHYMLTGRLPYGQHVTCLPPAAFIYRLGSGECTPCFDERDLHSASAAAFLRRCFVVDWKERASAAELLEHVWLTSAGDTPTT